MKVRKYVIKGPYPELTLPIEVRPPWYNTVWAWLVYITLVWFLVQAVLRYNLKNLHKEEQEKAEAERQAEQQQMQVIKNRMLEAELQNKNNELTLQTTALVKRNQAIQSLLEELEKQKETLGERYPNKLYIRMKTLMEETLNNQADWVLFESYFNSTHQNFMDRLRQRYSDLTTGDLRICCLLRMNLSTIRTGNRAAPIPSKEAFGAGRRYESRRFPNEFLKIFSQIFTSYILLHIR